jgi:hypothetical protein
MAIYLIMGAVRELLTQPDNDPTHIMTDYGNVDLRRSRWELSFGQSYRPTPNIIFGKAPKLASTPPA